MYGINLGLGKASGPKSPPPAIYNFMASSLPSGVTYSRTGAATDVINGVLSDFSAGTARVSTYNGLLIEEGRTNSLRNGEAQGAIVGIIGSGGELPTNWNVVNTVGLTLEVISSGMINGFNYIDLNISGTPSAGTFSLLFDGASQIAASSGQRWAASAYVALIAGGLTGISSSAVRVSGRASGSEIEGTSQSFTPTIDPTRISVLRQLNNGTTTHVISQLDYVVGAVAINATFRISSAQLENGYCTTSYIRTISGAVTRGADNPGLAVSSITGYDAAKGVFVTSVKVPNALAGGDQYVFAGTSGNDAIQQYRSQATFQIRNWIIKSGSLTGDTNTGGVIAALQTVKTAFRYAIHNVAASVNGATAVTDTTVPAMPSFTALTLGNNSGSGYLNGYLHSLKYYSTIKSDAELAVLSA